MQDTLKGYVTVCPDGSGRFVAVQVVPDRVSATGVSEKLSPTATQAVDDVQEIPLRLVDKCPDGSGRLVAVHVVPERVSATGVPEPV